MMNVINLNPAKVTRLQKAVAYLRREPAYRSCAALLATMRVTENTNIPTACTDGVSQVLVNPDYIADFSTIEAAAVLVHETLHKFNMVQPRFEAWAKRYPGVDRRALAMAYNMGQDYLINYSIKHDWQLPIQPGWLYNSDWHMGKYTSEALADHLLAENGGGDGGGSSGDESGDSEQGSSGAAGDGERGSGGLDKGDDVMAPPRPAEDGEEGDGKGTDRPMTDAEARDMEARIQRDIASAVRSAKGIGVDSSDFFHKQMADSVQAPTASLAKELSRLASELNRSGHRSWVTPNRKRFLPNGFPMPGPKDVKLGTIVAVIDTSGSTQGKTVAYFLNTLAKTMRNVMYKELVVLHCDTSVRHVQRYTKEQVAAGRIDLNAYGGGGTQFKPAFRWVQANVRGKVSALVYLTDGGVGHSDVMDCKRIWEGRRYPLLWALYSDWSSVDTFINWVTVNDRFGRVSRLPTDG